MFDKLVAMVYTMGIKNKKGVNHGNCNNKKTYKFKSR